MTDNCTCDCSIYSLLSELMSLLGLFYLDGQLQFSLYISMKKNPISPLWVPDYFTFFFTKFSRFLLVALASQGSQVLLFFGNYLICHLLLCYEYIFHLLSIFILTFLLWFFRNSFLNEVLGYSSSHPIFKILFC